LLRCDLSPKGGAVMRRLPIILLATSLLVGSSLAVAPAMAIDPCADMNISASPSILPPGDSLTISGSVTNCSDQAELITVNRRITGPCETDVRHTFRVYLEPGQSFSREETGPAPHCEGDYRIKGRAAFYGIELDRAFEIFTVCTPCQVLPRG